MEHNSYTLSKGDIQRAKTTQTTESDARDVLSGNLNTQLAKLFPKAPSEFLESNGHFANELARGAGEIADAVSAASIAITPADETKRMSSELVRLLAVDALVSAKLAIFPHLTDTGQLEFGALAGYLHPIFDPSNALKTIALLQVIPVQAGDEVQYQVRRYTAGMLEVFPPVKEWEKYEEDTPEQYPQPHAIDRLPVAFFIVRRDAHRRPYGLVTECLSAFRRYAKTAINTNAVQEIAGFPERVLKSDEWLKTAMGQTNIPPEQATKLLAEVRKVAARTLKVIGTGDDYLVQDGIDLAPHMAAEESHKQQLLDLLRSPDLSGGNLSGVALAERQTKSRALISGMCNAIATVTTEACQLAAGLPSSGIPDDVQVSLTPRFATDFAARIQQVADLYSKGVLPKSVALQELQTAGLDSITDALLQQISKEESADLEPY